MTEPVRRSYALPGGETQALVWPAPDRPLIVFAHANGFCASAYRRMLGALSGRFEIIAPDLRGHGRARLPADPSRHRSWDIYANDLLALYRSLERAPGLLAGHSMGASASLLAAAKLSDAPRLALVEPVVLPQPVYLAARTPLWPLFRRNVKLGEQARKRTNGWPDRESAAARYCQRPPFTLWAPGVVEDYLEDGLHRDEDGVWRLACDPMWEAANFEGQGHDLLRAARLAGSGARVLQAQKGSTVVNRPGLVKRGAAIERMDGVTHLAPMEAPERVADWIAKTFLER